LSRLIHCREKPQSDGQVREANGREGSFGGGKSQVTLPSRRSHPANPSFKCAKGRVVQAHVGGTPPVNMGISGPLFVAQHTDVFATMPR